MRRCTASNGVCSSVPVGRQLVRAGVLVVGRGAAAAASSGAEGASSGAMGTSSGMMIVGAERRETS